MLLFTMQMPVVQEKFKTFHPCCLFFCCRSAPLRIVARIPLGGYAPGQTINVDIEVDNKSAKEADFNVQLYKVRFISRLLC